MALLGSKRLVALDAGSVWSAEASWGMTGLRLRSLAGVALAPGALVPSSLEDNLRRPEEVRTALTALRDRLGADGRRVVLVLPDGLARTLLLEAPAAGATPLDYARFRLAQSLPYPADEAVVDVLSLDRGRMLASAVRRRVIAPYEAVAAQAGFAQERLDIAPLAAVAGLLRQGAARGRGVDVILGDAAVSLASFREGVLRVFRSRRRDPGPDEAERLSDEADRTADLAGQGPPPRLRLVGPGARALVRELQALGRDAEPGWPAGRRGLPEEAAELAWLGAALG